MALTLEQALDLAGYDWPRNNKLECPKGHDRSSASLHVYADTDSVYCFGCGFTADAYGTLAALTGKSVASVLAQHGESWDSTSTATKDLSRFKLRDSIHTAIMAATQPLFRSIRYDEWLTWQVDYLLVQACDWYETLKAELDDLPPFQVERRLSQLPNEIAEWLRERQITYDYR